MYIFCNSIFLLIYFLSIVIMLIADITLFIISKEYYMIMSILIVPINLIYLKIVFSILDKWQSKLTKMKNFKGKYTGT